MALAGATTVEDELKEKRADYKHRMERVAEREEALKHKREELEEELVQFYKYIQDNEIKRTRANKKATAEERAKEERHQKIVELSEDSRRLDQEKRESREQYLKYVKFQKYLEDVLQHQDNDEYQEPRDIILRWHTLDDNRNVLQRRKTQLEEELAKHKSSLAMKKTRKKNESVDLQNQVSERQNMLDSLQKLIKKLQDDLETSIGHRSTTTKTVGQVRMACQNLYDRCKRVTERYRSNAGVGRDIEGEEEGTKMVKQLDFIADCLDDYTHILMEWKKKKTKEEKDGVPEAPRRPPTLRRENSEAVA